MQMHHPAIRTPEDPICVQFASLHSPAKRISSFSPEKRNRQGGDKRAERGKIHEARRGRCGHRRAGPDPLPHILHCRSPITSTAAPYNACLSRGSHGRPPPARSLLPAPLSPPIPPPPCPDRVQCSGTRTFSLKINLGGQGSIVTLALFILDQP